VEKQLDHDGTEDFGKSILGTKTVNNILKELWYLKIQEAVGTWRRTAIHPCGQGGERKEDVHKLLRANIFAVEDK